MFLDPATKVENLSCSISILTRSKVLAWLSSRPMACIVLIIFISQFLFFSPRYIFLKFLKFKIIGVLFYFLLFLVHYRLFWWGEMKITERNFCFGFQYICNIFHIYFFSKIGNSTIQIKIFVQLSNKFRYYYVAWFKKTLICHHRNLIC